MTISTTTNKVQYEGDGVTTSFPYAFRVDNATDLKAVWTHLVAGVTTRTALTNDTHFTASGYGESTGGYVTYPKTGSAGAILLEDEYLTIYREVPITQELDLQQQQQYDSESVEDALDKQTMINQQQKENLARCLALTIDDTRDPTVIATDIANAKDEAVAAAAAAAGSETNAANSAIAAAASEAAALISANSASGSASAAYVSQSSASDYAAAALVSANTASTQAAVALISANSASGYATTASGYATAAGISATSASGYAASALTSANSASGSADEAAASAALVPNPTGQLSKYLKTNAEGTDWEFASATGGVVGHIIKYDTTAMTARTYLTAHKSYGMVAIDDAANDQTYLAISLANLPTKTSASVDADYIAIVDSEASSVPKKMTFLNAWTNYYKTKADLLYPALSAATTDNVLLRSNLTAGQYQPTNISVSDGNIMSFPSPGGVDQAVKTLTSATTVTIDFADSNYFTLTLGANCNIANPSNIPAANAKGGVLWLIQDSTGSRIPTWGSYWNFAGGTAPTLSTAGGSVDVIPFCIRSSTNIDCGFLKGMS